MLAWIDLEMTGLDPDRHVIVEIATLLTDDELDLVAEGPELVIHASDAELADMDDFVADMHTRSGLLDKIRRSTVTVGEAAAQTMMFLREHIPEPGTVPLCGNSIGTDRRFLARHMSEVEEHLNYRSIDVSTLKELCQRWRPEICATRPHKARRHRALDDIRESLAELRHYRQVLFAGEDPLRRDHTEPNPGDFDNPEDFDNDVYEHDEWDFFDEPDSEEPDNEKPGSAP